jgi:hypothetical protein
VLSPRNIYDDSKAIAAAISNGQSGGGVTVRKQLVPSSVINCPLPYRLRKWYSLKAETQAQDKRFALQQKSDSIDFAPACQAEVANGDPGTAGLILQ